MKGKINNSRELHNSGVNTVQRYDIYKYFDYTGTHVDNNLACQP